jgi:uncharacterized protein (DUF58 family)
VALFADRDPDRPRYRTRFLKAGVVYVIAILVMGIASGARPNNLIIWVFSAMMAALLASGIVSGFMMTPLQTTRLEPRRGRVGEPLLIRYEIANRSRFMPAYDLAVVESVDPRMLEPAGNAWVMHAGPGDVVHAEAVFRPVRRGRVGLSGFEVSTTFPFGLLRKIVRISHRGELLVHPEILPIRADLLARVTSGAFGGQRLSQRGGGDDEFFGVREYRSGDSIRHIAWKRLAGTGQIASIERGRAVPPRVRVLLDLRTPTASLRLAPGEDARTLEERAIVIAASTIALADRLGYEYALSVAGIAIPSVALRKGHFHREKIMSLLAAIDLDAPRVAGNGLSSSDERATLVCVHPDRADPGVAPESAWHFTARQLDALLEPRGEPGEARAPAPAAAAGGGAA